MSRHWRDSAHTEQTNGKSVAGSASYQGLPSYPLNYPVPPSHTQSKKWINPAIVDRARVQKLNEAREKFCKRSPFFHKDFDLDRHRREMAEDYCGTVVRSTSGLLGATIEPAFGGRVLNTNRGAVLMYETAFSSAYDVDQYLDNSVPQFAQLGPFAMAEQPREIARWPSQAECRYEGDERISTDLIHSRFLPVPRVASNVTVNWMQRSMITPYWFEDYYPRYHSNPHSWRIECTTKTHYIDLQISPVSDEGGVLVSSDLMDELDA